MHRCAKSLVRVVYGMSRAAYKRDRRKHAFCYRSHRYARRRRLRLDVLLSRPAASLVHLASANASRSAALVLRPRRDLEQSRSAARRLPRRAALLGDRGAALAGELARRPGRAGARTAARLVAAYHRARLANAGLAPRAVAALGRGAARGPRWPPPKSRYRVWRHFPLLRRAGSSAPEAACSYQPPGA